MSHRDSNSRQVGAHYDRSPRLTTLANERHLTLDPALVDGAAEALSSFGARLEALRSIPLEYVGETFEPRLGDAWIDSFEPAGRSEQGSITTNGQSGGRGSELDTTKMSLTELTSLYATGALSPSEVLQACLDRIEQVNPRIDALASVLVEGATEAAAASTVRWQRGQPASPIDGIPYVVKDLVATAGAHTRGGSSIYEGNIPTTSASVIDRLEQGGGILLGKAHTFEFALRDRRAGPGRNPWDLTRTPGGSSEGSGSAVAACLVPFAIGTDTGGSLRIPAGFCGITGLKPTLGLVPTDGVMPLSWTLDHVGPMARSVLDLQALLPIMSGQGNTSDRWWRASQNPDIVEHGGERPLRDVVVGLPKDWFFDVCDPSVVDATLGVAEVLQQAGATVRDVGIPSGLMAEAAHWIIMLAEASSAHEIHLDRLAELGPQNARLILAGFAIEATDYIRAQRIRRLVQGQFETLFADVDVLLAPGPVCVAPRLDDELAEVGDRSYHWLDVITRTTRVFNLTGLPSLALPAGFKGGLPVGVQIAARPNADETCLRGGIL